MKKYIITAILFATMTFGVQAAVQAPVKAPVKAPVQQVQAAKIYVNATPLDLVNNPAKYLNKYVTVKAKFDKFSTLGLDYKPAYRSSETYISFLVKRDDVKDHNIPLSELKIFLSRKIAEKHIELNSGDEIEFKGLVFSNALGDVWVDADAFTVLKTNTKPAK